MARDIVGIDPGQEYVDSQKGAANGVATLDADGFVTEPRFSMENLYSRSDAQGRYYSFNIGTMTTTVPNEGYLYLVPWLLHEPMAIDRIAVSISSAGSTGAVIRLGAFTHVGGRLSGMVTGWEKLFDAGTVTGESTGIQETTIDEVLPRGLVALGIVAQGGATTRPTVDAVTPMRSPLLGFRTSNFTSAGAVKLQTGVSGTFDDDYVAPNYSASSPIVAVRVKQ